VDGLQATYNRRQEGVFLEKEAAESVALRSFVQPQASVKAMAFAKQQFNFVIDKDIVEKIIGDMLFDPDVECAGDDGNVTRFNVAKANAMKIFTKNAEDGTYTIMVKSILKMNMIVKFVAVGVSFRQASKLYQSVKEETGMGVLGSASNLEVAQKCRIICAINLQYLKELFENVWSFSIGLDAGNNAGTSYLDVHVRCYYKESLHNFHLLAIPMRKRHTDEYMFDLVVSILGVVAPKWRYQLIGIATDGASSMTGSISGTCTRLARECHASIFRIWCGAHQLDLVMKKAFAKLCNERFLNTVTSMTGHLRRQANLITEMKSMCPTFASTRWISKGKVLKWMKDNRLRLQQHFFQKNPTCTPPRDFWIIICVLQPLVDRIEKTFMSLQGLDTLVCEQ
jgi:hypothetical protein